MISNNFNGNWVQQVFTNYKCFIIYVFFKISYLLFLYISIWIDDILVYVYENKVSTQNNI